MTPSITSIASGNTATFPSPVGPGTPTVTVNGSPAAVLSSNLETVTLTATPVLGATVVVSLSVDIPSPVAVAAYDTQDDMLKVKTTQKKYRDPFSDLSRWDVSLTGGMTASVGSGVLNVVTGTAINATATLTSKETFTIPFRVSMAVQLSQRIANQDFMLEAVSVDPNTGIPDEKNLCAFRWTGTVATDALLRTKLNGMTTLESSTVTMTTTAGGAYFELEPFVDEVWFHSGVLDATSGRAASFRRQRQCPDPNAVYKLRLRAVNAPTAPASSTTWSFSHLAVQDYAELTAEITAGRGNSSAGQAMAVNVTTMPGVTVSASTPTNPPGAVVNSGANTNATLLKNSPGTLYGGGVFNAGAAAAYLKLYNLTVAPTVGTSVPVLVVTVPAGGFVPLDFGALGIRFSAGLSLAITGGIADTDTTAVAASQVKVMLGYL